MTEPHSITPYKPPSVQRLRELTSSTVEAAIHSPSDAAATIRRANQCLALYFQADDDAETRLAVRQAFARALDGLPTWAMLRAFDAWEKSSTRRPSPAEIVILAQRELAPFVAEIKRRQAPPPEPARQTPTAEEAARIMAQAGFTPGRIAAVRSAPMATTFSEAEDRGTTDRASRHWTETADPDGAQWAALRAARANNPLMRPRAGRDDERAAE